MANPEPVLQSVALTLPAVALYMGVLSDIYADAAEANSLYPDPESEAFQGPGPSTGDIDKKVHRGWVTLTTVMNGFDYRVGVLSMVSLTFSAVVLLPTLAFDFQRVYLLGLGLATLGYVFLGVALSYTAYASFYERYPRS